MPQYKKTCLILLLFCIIFCLSCRKRKIEPIIEDRSYLSSIAGSASPLAIQADKAGNIYVVGNFNGTIMIDDSRLTAQSSMDMFLAKYDRTGKISWVKHVKSTTGETGLNTIVANDLVVDESGNIYVTGYFSKDAMFDNLLLTSTGEADIFIAKYTNSGNVTWVKSAGGKLSSDISTSMDIDNKGDVYITGRISANATFDAISINPKSSNDMGFITKYTSSGNVEWVKNTGGVFCNDIVISPKNDIVITGYFYGMSTFGDIQIKAEDSGMFIAKFDHTGKAVWVKDTGSKGNSGRNIGYKLALDGNNNIFVSGLFYETMLADNMTLTSKGSEDIFILKYSEAGDLLSAKSLGGPYSEQLGDLKIDKANNSYVSGDFSQDIHVDNTSLTSTGERDIFVVKYNNTGTTQWTRNFGGTSGDGSSKLEIIEEKAYLSGQYTNKIILGDTTLSTSNAGLFIWEIK